MWRILFDHTSLGRSSQHKVHVDGTGEQEPQKELLSSPLVSFLFFSFAQRLLSAPRCFTFLLSHFYQRGGLRAGPLLLMAPLVVLFFSPVVLLLTKAPLASSILRVAVVVVVPLI